MAAGRRPSGPLPPSVQDEVGADGRLEVAMSETSMVCLNLQYSQTPHLLLHWSRRPVRGQLQSDGPLQRWHEGPIQGGAVQTPGSRLPSAQQDCAVFHQRRGGGVGLLRGERVGAGETPGDVRRQVCRASRHSAVSSMTSQWD